MVKLDQANTILNLLKRGPSVRKIIMSRKETNQITIFECLMRKEISQKAAGQALNLTPRQIRNKLKQYRATGPEGLIHKNRGKISNRRWASDVKKRSIALIRELYSDFGPTFATEKLYELHNIKISDETLRKAMHEAGLWCVEERKPKYRSRRERKACLGTMIQLDGSHHHWFEERGPKCVLIVFIDDATSNILWANFGPAESLETVFKGTYDYLMKWGIPRSFYVDFGSVFSVHRNNENNDKITQFERAMGELTAEVIHARSPQAKGRVERSNRTLQDRLIKEMRLAGISSIEAANRFVQEVYIPRHNARFAVKPIDPANMHKPIDGIALDRILCVRSKRILSNDFTIKYGGEIFQLDRMQPVKIHPKKLITVNQLLDGKILLSFKGVYLNFRNGRDPKPVAARKHIDRVANKPAANHPWNQSLKQTLHLVEGKWRLFK